MNRARQLFAAVATLMTLTASCAPEEHGGAGVAAVTVPGVSGPALPMTTPGDIGMSEDGIARIALAMQAFVDDGRLPGVMTMIAVGGKIVHWEAVGKRDIEAGDPLEPDDIFRIYSMTKPITSAATMMLVESGDLKLDDPVAKFIPGFADLTVIRPAVTITKAAYEDDQSGPLAANPVPGDFFQYRIEVTNNGTANATSVVVTDDLPAELTFDSTSDDGNWGAITFADPTVTAPLSGPLTPGNSAVFWIRVQVN